MASWRPSTQYNLINHSLVRDPDQYVVVSPYFNVPGCWLHEKESSSLQTHATTPSSFDQSDPFSGCTESEGFSFASFSEHTRVSYGSECDPLFELGDPAFSVHPPVQRLTMAQVLADHASDMKYAALQFRDPFPSTYTPHPQRNILSQATWTTLPACILDIYYTMPASTPEYSTASPLSPPPESDTVEPLTPDAPQAPGSSTRSILNNSDIISRISDLTAACQDKPRNDSPPEGPFQEAALKKKAVSERQADPRLAPAIELAKTFLSHFYPASQGFSLRETAFDTMQHGRCGWNIEVKTAPGYSAVLHRIPTECIAGFLVENTCEVDDDATPDGKRKTPIVVTAMAIMADDLSTESTWVPYPTVTLGDIMSYDLGKIAGVAITNCFILIGTQLQLWTWDSTKSEGLMMRPYKHQDRVLAKMGSTFKLAVEGKHWEYNLKLFDRVMTDAIKSDVVYTDGSRIDGVYVD
ncbi:uncharacterized protein BDZ99DRAFT_285016 [Mytilinidion resinicola]|uniref:Uncharacterized protein n=1 Tax=Mytilinidion resinicola TaxID=574789 RepID=A0A6A6YVH6_9PEZI|nr:uncharacterized protein BDZ99DRAFT_285016 [Mytilinidion resinicola]KAF2811994.1 hypothetical protein BDZ99DRAFT_285016 [Mytilinidion resinicola]